MEAWKVYQLYAELYQVLTCWLSRYLQGDVADKVIRLTLADSFRWASNAVQGLYGPYADAAEAAMGRALGMEVSQEAEGWMWPMQTLPAGTPEFHHRMAHLYSTVYAAVFEAGLTLTERERVFMMIRMHDPVFLPESEPPPNLEEILEKMPVLRRVFSAIVTHRCDGRLVCPVSEQIWREETDKGISWMKAQLSREEGR